MSGQPFGKNFFPVFNFYFLTAVPTFQEAPNKRLKRLNQGSNVSLEWSTQFCNPSSPKELHRILGELGAAPRGRWGQNFLIDRAAQRRIVEAAQIQQHESVWEIGPGLGALTQHLWRSCRDLTLFEIDPILIQFYKNRISAPYEGREPGEGRKPSVGRKPCQLSPNCQLIEGDVCQTWQTAQKAQAEQAQQGGPDAVIGNLPYNSASLLLRQFAMQTGFRPALHGFYGAKRVCRTPKGPNRHQSVFFV